MAHNIFMVYRTQLRGTMPLSPEEKESTYVAVRLLGGLKEVFTFKELEELLEIPAQVLWRYTSHVQFPERGTAKKLLDAIGSKHLLERAIRELVITPQGIVEEWRLFFNPRFLNLIGYIAWRTFGKDNLDLVLATCERDSALAATVADWLSADACVATERAWASWGRLYTAPYRSSERGETIYLHVPKEVLERGTRVLIVKGVARNFESLHALTSIIEQAKSELIGVLIVAAISEEWSVNVEKEGVKKTKVIVQKTPKGFEVSL